MVTLKKEVLINTAIDVRGLIRKLNGDLISNVTQITMTIRDLVRETSTTTDIPLSSLFEYPVLDNVWTDNDIGYNFYYEIPGIAIPGVYSIMFTFYYDGLWVAYGSQVHVKEKL